MYKVDKKKCLAALFCINIIGYVIAAPAIDPDLDQYRAVVLAEREVRLLEKDLNGKGEWIPEEDMILLTVMTRERLNMIPYNDLYSNPNFVRSEAGKAMIQFVSKRAHQHASAVTNNPFVIANAAKVESTEFMGLLHKNPLREGKQLYHYFGKTFENRVKDNVINRRKY